MIVLGKCRCIRNAFSFYNKSVRPLRHYINRHNHSRKIVMGIETSCDDTGCAILDDTGKILGESLFSQLKMHVEMGGINPTIARELHEENIERVVDEAMSSANIQLNDIDAIAVTTEPGLVVSLKVGLCYAKELSEISGKPIIPIHHMQAHALTARMIQKVEFPFLVLLISGGHCLLCVAHSPVKFQLLGDSLNDSPGEAMDKIARRLKLRFLPGLRDCCGGEAIERAARKGTPETVKMPIPLLHYRNCDFSFSGYKQRAMKYVRLQEEKHGIIGSSLIPDVYDLCASLLHSLTQHICHRVQRGMVFVEESNIIPSENKTLVVSGGVACNSYIKQALGIICREMNYNLVVPPPKLCTDNGVMIAWNGIEKLKLGVDVISTDQIGALDFKRRSIIGEDIKSSVLNASIKCKWIKLKELYEKSSENEISSKNEKSNLKS